jgi:hypothetical protein
MSELPDRELEEEARTLLGAVSTPEPVPAAVKARALRRLLLALPALGPVSSHPPDPQTSGPAAARGLARVFAARVPAWSLVVSFAAGGALAAAAMRKPAATSPVASPLASSVSASALPSAPPPLPQELATASARAEPAPSVSARAAPRPPKERTGASPSTRTGGDNTLAAELAIVEKARNAVGRGDGAGALQAIEEHERKFPRGALDQEREAMAIQALRLLGREGEAEARLDRFRARFPTSALLPALEAGQKGAP